MVPKSKLFNHNSKEIQTVQFPFLLEGKNQLFHSSLHFPFSLKTRWAAKEATYKALTTSCHSRKNNLNVNSNDVNFKNSSPRFPFTDLKVTSNPTQMNIEGFTKQFIQTLLFSNNNNDNNNNNKNVEKESWNVLISISHEDEYAIATATLQSLD